MMLLASRRQPVDSIHSASAYPRLQGRDEINCRSYIVSGHRQSRRDTGGSLQPTRASPVQSLGRVDQYRNDFDSGVSLKIDWLTRIDTLETVVCREQTSTVQLMPTTLASTPDRSEGVATSHYHSRPPHPHKSAQYATMYHCSNP